MDDVLTDPTFLVTSAVLFHPDLRSVEDNTALSGNGQPSPFYMLFYHRDRMLAAVNDLPGDKVAMLQSIAGSSGLESMRSTAMQTAGTRPSKLRFTLDRNGNLTCSNIDLGGVDLSFNASEYFPANLPDPLRLRQEPVRWLVGMSIQAMQKDFTTIHKTSLRKQYNVAFETAPEASNAYRSEVLVYNEQDQIMEGCSTTPYFWRNGRWTTPHAKCGGNLGTTRRWSLDKGLAIEGIISRHEVSFDELIILSNGVRGFGVGRIVNI